MLGLKLSPGRRVARILPQLTRRGEGGAEGRAGGGSRSTEALHSLHASAILEKSSTGGVEYFCVSAI